MLDEAFLAYRIGIPEHDGSLTYKKIAELIRERGLTEFPRYKELLEFTVQNLNSNTALHRAHEPDVFDGDMIMFSAAMDHEGARRSSILPSWRPYVAGDITEYSVDCTHEEMLTTESLSMYGIQLKDSFVLGSTHVPGILDPEQGWGY
jgi:hypothetical protein